VAKNASARALSYDELVRVAGWVAGCDGGFVQAVQRAVLDEVDVRAEVVVLTSDLFTLMAADRAQRSSRLL
jgi:hypothetical protein